MFPKMTGKMASSVVSRAQPRNGADVGLSDERCDSQVFRPGRVHQARFTGSTHLSAGCSRRSTGNAASDNGTVILA
jgi:hypothetical protein